MLQPPEMTKFWDALRKEIDHSDQKAKEWYALHQKNLDRLTQQSQGGSTETAQPQRFDWLDIE